MVVRTSALMRHNGRASLPGAVRRRLYLRSTLILSLCLSAPLEGLTILRFGGEDLPPPHTDFVQLTWEDVDLRSHGASQGILMDAGSIAPIQFPPDTNLTPLMHQWGGEVLYWDPLDAYGGFIPLPAVDSEAYVADGDPETAFLGKSRDGRRVNAFWLLDFGVPIPIQRIRITCRDRFAQERFLQWFELYGSDRPDLFKGLNLTGDAELIFETSENIDPRFETNLTGTTTRGVALWVRPPAFKPWEISEIEVYGSGFIPEARYRTNVLDFGEAANIGSLEWSGETGMGASIEVRARAGDDDDPNAYFRRTYRGEEQVPSGSDGNTLTRDSYEALELQERGSITHDAVNWTLWSGPVDSTAATPLASRPRRFAQVDITFHSNQYGTGHLDYLQFAASPALATALVAEIDPAVARAGNATAFTFRFRPQLEPDDPGFDTIAIDTPAPPLAVEAVSIGAAATDFERVRLDDRGFAVRLPTRIDVAKSMELIEIAFVAEVFEYGASFAGRVYDSSKPDELPQPIPAGDADELADSNSLQVALADIPDRAIHAFRLSAGAFTPNGDEVNDRVRVEYELLNLRGGAPLTIAIYDLAGRRIAAVDAGPTDNGRSHVEWDGTGTDGLPVPPGIYLVAGSLETDAGEERASRAVAVAY